MIVEQIHFPFLFTFTPKTNNFSAFVVKYYHILFLNTTDFTKITIYKAKITIFKAKIYPCAVVTILFTFFKEFFVFRRIHNFLYDSHKFAIFFLLSSSFDSWAKCYFFNQKNFKRGTNTWNYRF